MITTQIDLTLEDSKLKQLFRQFEDSAQKGFDAQRWGDIPKWQASLKQLPEINPSIIDLNSAIIQVGAQEDCSDAFRQQLDQELRSFHPWRKGPFNVFGVSIDSEWRSDMKWDRLKDHMTPLKDRVILDVGCNNGYFCLRMAGQGAKAVIGIDSLPLYVMQFQAIQKYIQKTNVLVFPMKIEDVPASLHEFDTVFSMGMLYHRRAPLDHLLQLKDLLREGGELVLETLVTNGKAGEVLSPHGRYACMPNVWFIPSVLTLESWLIRMGFTNVRCIDVTQTTSQEQRVTEWMGFQSLEHFLDPDNPDLTKEGFPAPQRAIVLANRL